jgi:hypothetical protein
VCAGDDGTRVKQSKALQQNSIEIISCDICRPERAINDESNSMGAGRERENGRMRNQSVKLYYEQSDWQTIRQIDRLAGWLTD